MPELIKNITLVIVLAPLLGSIIAGLFGKVIGKSGAHWITILLMLVSFIATLIVFKWVVLDGSSFYGPIYTWALSGKFRFDIGFMVDNLTAAMMVIVTFVSLIVHIYSVGYMRGDPGYQRFFSYMSLFTFAMLMLVSANNFLQLYFGWEGVGLVSYLLIGFWFAKESAARGSLKAFLVNRVGDFGFILGIAAILDSMGTVDYRTVFAKIDSLSNTMISIFPNTHWSLITMIAILLFIGAMGKSAQMPLHVWLPESMEGPTPISALIHAATMVTAGVFMVARMSPIYELTEVGLSVVLIIGATGALFMGLLAFVENDIKRVIAYSTMSQLGYMMAGNGASAFSAGIFHLFTHACFKALLFLAAGSVIIAVHHEQDMRRMGGLWKRLPVTYICFLIGALALAAIPPFAGFYSKDSIIQAVSYSTIPGATYAYWCLLIGVFVTSFYIFRAFFMTFHTKERMAEDVKSHIKEQWIMLVPLILLAIPSIVLGGLLIKWILYSKPGLLGSGIYVLPQYDVLKQMSVEFHGAIRMIWHSFATLPFWLSVAGIVVAWLTVVIVPKFLEVLKKRLYWLYWILSGQYGFDKLNEILFTRGGMKLADFFFKFGDLKVIDDFMVNGSGRSIGFFSRIMRRLQSGYLYHYVFVMIIGILAFLCWMFFAR